jgi:hypothetical protein
MNYNQNINEILTELLRTNSRKEVLGNLCKF